MNTFDRWTVWYTKAGIAEYAASYHWTRRGAFLFAARLNHQRPLELNEAFVVKRRVREDSM